MSQFCNILDRENSPNGLTDALLKKRIKTKLTSILVF